MDQHLVQALRNEANNLERKAKKIRALLAEFDSKEPELFDARPTFSQSNSKLNDVITNNPLDKMGMRDAVRFAFRENEGTLSSQELTDWLQKQGYRPAGKTKLSNRVRSEIHNLRKKGQIVLDEQTQKYRLA